MKREIGRFFILGAFSTLVDYIVYSFAIYLNINYIIAIIMGYSVGLIFNYYFGKKFVFLKGVKLKKEKLEFILVSFIALVGMMLNIIIVNLLSYTIFEISLFYSRIIAIGIVFFWNYYLRKIFVYH